MKGQRVLAAALCASLIALPALCAEPVAAKLDPRIFEGVGAWQTKSFIVVMREPADLSGADRIADRSARRCFVYEALRDQADRTQAGIRAVLDNAGVRYRSFYITNMIEVEGGVSLAETLAAREDVSSVIRNDPLRLSPAPPAVDATPLRASPSVAATVEPNITLIGAPAVWAQGYKGQGIVIGLIDDGFSWEHPALKRQYRGWDGTNASYDYNWHDAVHDIEPGDTCGGPNSPTPCDSVFGTAAAGLSVGDDGLGNQIGVAPEARFFGCRAFAEGPNIGTVARFTECLQFCLAPTDHNGANPRPDLGADVINNSWTCDPVDGCTAFDALQTIFENVRAAGVFSVAAAGTKGTCATIAVPAGYDTVFAVGATVTDGVASISSSRGPVTADGSNRLKPDVCAPGVGLRVALQAEGYGVLDGNTGFSTPEVAGAVALLWSAAPDLIGQITATADVLRSTAVGFKSTEDCPPYPGNMVPNAVFGYGRIDVAAAVDASSHQNREKPIEPKRTRPPHVVSPR
ncbi:MAG TPA: S8 family serine peptidase [Thermoanaerobaculia bacterium]